MNDDFLIHLAVYLPKNSAWIVHCAIATNTKNNLYLMFMKKKNRTDCHFGTHIFQMKFCQWKLRYTVTIGYLHEYMKSQVNVITINAHLSGIPGMEWFAGTNVWLNHNLNVLFNHENKQSTFWN